MKTIETEFSTYEVDEPNRRIRRVEGVNPPTARFGEDGVWHEFIEFTHHEGRFWVVWPDGNATVSSEIVLVAEREDNNQEDSK